MRRRTGCICWHNSKRTSGTSRWSSPSPGACQLANPDAKWPPVSSITIQTSLFRPNPTFTKPLDRPNPGRSSMQDVVSPEEASPSPPASWPSIRRPICPGPCEGDFTKTHGNWERKVRHQNDIRKWIISLCKTHFFFTVISALLTLKRPERTFSCNMTVKNE